MTDDQETRHFIAIAQTVIQAGVDQLQKADLSQDDPQIVVARIYIAMEIAAMLVEQDLAETLALGALPPMDKSKLN